MKNIQMWIIREFHLFGNHIPPPPKPNRQIKQIYILFCDLNVGFYNIFFVEASIKGEFIELTTFEGAVCTAFCF